MSAPAKPADADLDRAIAAAGAPEVHGRANPAGDEAMGYLRAHAEVASARIVARIDAAPPLDQVGLCRLLGLLGQNDAVAPLSRVLAAGKDLAALAAARALAAHPAPGARAALIEGVSGAHAGTVSASADALAAARFKGGCTALRKQLAHPDANVRWHVVSAALAMSCLGDEDVARVSRDADPDVAALAKKAK